MPNGGLPYTQRRVADLAVELLPDALNLEVLTGELARLREHVILQDGAVYAQKVVYVEWGYARSPTPNARVERRRCFGCCLCW
jgi:hypothetical protein